MSNIFKPQTFWATSGKEDFQLSRFSDHSDEQFLSGSDIGYPIQMPTNNIVVIHVTNHKNLLSNWPAV